MISVRNLTKSYSAHGAVVDNLSLGVAEGECVVLVGKSGCGKSTTLKMINGLVTPDAGAVTVAGETVGGADLPRLRRRIGYVIQSGGLFPHLTVAGNIALVARLKRWSREKREARVRELLEMVGLEPGRFAQKFPLELSGGEQQRVGVARALMLDPPILLMDEPFGAVDPITRRQLQKDFLALQTHLTRRKTIVFVTHDIREALLLGNRIAVMESGRILQIGTPEEIQANPATDFIKDFFS